MAFRDVAPQARPASSSSPKRPIASLHDAKPEDAAVLGHLLVVASEVARELGLERAARGSSSTGAGAGRTVFHLHVHVLAGRPLAWPPG